jgi:hypothetical protein
MALRNFDSPADVLPRRQVVKPTEEPVTVIEEVKVTPRANTYHGHLTVADDQWTWRELRDFVVDRIEAHHGTFPRNEVTEAAIFKRFMTQWGTAAPTIARYAFGDECQGYWKGAPISVNRFCRSSDPWFAMPISDRLGLAR